MLNFLLLHAWISYLQYYCIIAKTSNKSNNFSNLVQHTFHSCNFIFWLSNYPCLHFIFLELFKSIRPSAVLSWRVIVLPAMTLYFYCQFLRGEVHVQCTYQELPVVLVYLQSIFNAGWFHSSLSGRKLFKTYYWLLLAYHMSKGHRFGCRSLTWQFWKSFDVMSCLALRHQVSESLTSSLYYFSWTTKIAMICMRAVLLSKSWAKGVSDVCWKQSTDSVYHHQ